LPTVPGGGEGGEGRKVKLAYVAGPYRARGEWAVHQNIQRASEIALELWQMGFAVICPHRNTAFFGGAAPDDVWLKGDLEMLSRCDLMVLVPNWDLSSGTQEEIKFAEARNIPIYRWPDEAGDLAELGIR
jgi:nucleoside 2-deoxyribosyltransferase